MPTIKPHPSTWKYDYDVLTVPVPPGWTLAVQRGVSGGYGTTWGGYGTTWPDVRQDGQTLIVHLRKPRTPRQD